MWPEWLTLAFYKGLWEDFTEYWDDFPILVLKGVTEAVAGIIESIAPPDFLAQYRLADVMAPAMGDLGYFLAQAGISQALAMIATAVVFRVMRKFLTFGIW